jgi:DNA-binding NarL/FixJ family response regulator
MSFLSGSKRTRQIVEDPGVSPATMQTHVENTLGELGIHSRLETVVVASREHLI